MNILRRLFAKHVLGDEIGSMVWFPEEATRALKNAARRCGMNVQKYVQNALATYECIAIEVKEGDASLILRYPDGTEKRVIIERELEQYALELERNLQS